MIQLMIIADDFTGALDTGVHFAEKGIQTRVIILPENEKNWVRRVDSEQTEVLVVDTETRHMSKEMAFLRVFEAVTEGKKAGVSCVYKKTDSALRGNIGGELEAACRASGEKILPFIPALPKLNRVTRKGKQYIDGILVSKSVFGMDLFEPVRKDSVKEIIHLQSEIAVTEVPNADQITWEDGGIMVFDAETEEDIKKIGKKLAESGHIRVLAGCAGFASVLPELLGFQCRKPETPILEKKLLVICGSVNQITQKQLECGEKAGYSRIYMTPEKKLYREFWESEAGEQLVRRIIQKSQQQACVMIDSNDQNGAMTTMAYAEEKGIGLEQVRVKISEVLGIILKKLLDAGMRPVILVTGGDTLIGFMREIGQWELQPVREIRPGCVLTTLNYHSREYHIITKSGGFGKENLLVELTDELKA